jgi:hypothetical protein
VADNNNVVPFPPPDPRRDMLRVVERYAQLSPDAEAALARTVEISALFEQLPA